MKKIFALLLLTFVSLPAYADWGEVGAAALCAANGQSFELAPTLETSGWGDIPAPPGAHKFPIGAEQHYHCKVGSSRVSLIIDVYPPGQGMGEGAGVITIEKLMVDKKILLTNTYFNWQVSSEPELSRVAIEHTKNGIVEQLCYAADTTNPQSHTHCDTKQISGSNGSFKRTGGKAPPAA
ncbi:hypothetical protein [Oleiagrimonas sp.]|jgi:hypothetical protein|uniref:hypothetical protein n=1 Tax=Oleiagrimonas sp. TaxID=2010330 RepID=UPI00261DC314|nr:hypothetical protein [Oleiagrimonas sp.]MDA3913834.1 hypothetical protein [Oleiagrimonas sp.]